MDLANAEKLTGQTIVCISSIDWDFIWQGHQQIMSTLAAQGNKVLFIENTGVRRPQIRDVGRLRHRLRNWRRGTKGFREEMENLYVYSPVVLPLPYSRIARWINRTIVVRAVRRWMDALDAKRPLAWTFLPTPLALDVIKGIDPELVVYYCIDDFAASSAGARGIRRSETRLFREADLVFVTSEKLRARAAEVRDQVDVFPFAVAYERFAAVREAEDEMPADLRALRPPLVGYVGGLHRFVDQELVTEAARRLPDISFVLVGPEQCDVSRLEREPNIHLLGARSHTDLPAYIKGFDVGTVPYIFDPYTENVYPTKLNEYLAMGIPVIATGLAEIVRFNERHGEIVDIANDADAFVAAIRRSVNADSPAEISGRIAVAKENSWESRLAGMSAIIQKSLSERRLRPNGWEERLRRIYRSSRRRLLTPAAILLAIYLVLFHTPLIWLAAEPLRASETPRPADAIVVFAGGVGESGAAGGGYQERVRHAVELYQAGYAPRLIFSSGFVFAFRETEVMRSLAVSLGVPADSIILEQQAGSTLENVTYVHDILQRESMDEILLVSSPYHMRRAMLTWQKQAPEIAVAPTPASQSQFYSRDDGGASFQQIRGILWEYLAILSYWLRGWI